MAVRQKNKKTARKTVRAEAYEADSVRRWALKLIASMPDPVCLCRDGDILYANAAAAHFMGGRSPKKVIGSSFIDFVAEEDRRAAAALLRAAASRRAPALSIRLDGTGGRRMDAEMRTVALAGEARGTVIVHARDVTDQRVVEALLRGVRDEMEGQIVARTRELDLEVAERRRVEDNLRLAAKVIEATSEAVVIADARFRVTSVNPSFTEITGYQPAEVIGRQAPLFRVLKRTPALRAEMEKAIARQGHWQGEFWTKRKTQEDQALRLSLSAIADDGGDIFQYAALFSDVTKRRADEEEFRRQANFDALTGLPNRTLFLDRLTQSITAMKRGGRKLALMFLDLDGFKLVNDTLGHDMGDKLLQQTAQRLTRCVRAADTVARLGGDEFTVIMPGLADTRKVPAVAQRILDALSEPFQLDGNETFVFGSIGITVYPDDAEDPGNLIRNADSAMYRAKDQGKANYQFFTADLNEEVKARMVLKNSLIRARERDEFSLHFQPKLDLRSGGITGVEALMRWESEGLGKVSPGRFIPAMEETGMVVEIGEWAIRTACEQHLAWRAAGLPPIRVAVNLSARQLREHNFVTIVRQVLESTGVGPEGLEIEITESMLMSDTANVVVTLKKLHDLGIRIAMDDFGTGYSSLSYLKQFPIDTIKIDRSFISDIATAADDVEIVKAIITMGQSLNRRVVAEGVETEDQVAILRKYECDEIQGYVLCRPMPAAALTEFLQARMLEAA